MRMLKSYLRQRKSLFLKSAAFYAVFLGAFLLYRLPAEAVLYPAVLCILGADCFIALDYRKVRRKCQRLINRFCEEQLWEKETMDHRFQNMTEYYTLWAHQIKTPIAAMRLQLLRLFEEQ